MNDKLKKAIAVGGASLMAAGTVVPSSLAANKNDEKKFANKALTYVKGNAVHTGVTGALTLTTAALLVKSIFGGKTIPGLPFTDAEKAFLWQMDLSEKKEVLTFVEQLSDDACEFELEKDESTNETKIKFTKTKNKIMKETLYPSEDTKAYTVEALLFKLITAMDKGNTYVAADDTLTATGANILNALAPYFVEEINNKINSISAQIAEAKQAKEYANNAVTTAESDKTKLEEQLKTANETKSQADTEVSKAGESVSDEQKKAATDADAAVTGLEQQVTDATTAVNNAKTRLEECEGHVNTLEELAIKFNGLKLELKRGKFKVGDKKTEPQPAPTPTQQPNQ